jgi:hypothetical protein
MTITLDDSYNLRECFRAVLSRHGMADNEQLVWELESAVKKLVAGVQPPAPVYGKQKVQQMTLDAMVEGMSKEGEIRSLWARLFRTNPNWDTKTNQAAMVWFKSVPKEQTLIEFSKWWFKEDWRGKQGQSPTNPDQVRELWPQAFTARPEMAHTERPGAPLPDGI